MMRSNLTRRASAAATLVAASGLLAAAPAGASQKLSGELKLTPGKAKTVNGKVTASGTYFRMIQPGGQFFLNPNSNAGHTPQAQTYTLLGIGKDGGLKLGAYQPAPSGSAAFNNGNATADSITKPEKFQGIEFSISTNKKDAQTNTPDPAPSLTLNGDKVTGNLSAWDAQWNNQSFNQGSPKPTGAKYPSGTRPVTGTYNKKTHAVTLTWYSYIVGGPFSGFTGYWHLQGKIVK